MTADRGVSAAVDAALCLLLISASVLTLTAVSPPAPDETTDVRRGAELLGSTTATVAHGDRVARGTLAALLADAAVLDARGEARPAYRAGVENATRRALSGLAGEVQVRVRWGPGPDDPAAGTVVVGDAPPRDADVRAARLSVPAGGPINRTASGRATVVVRGWRG